LSFRRRTPWRFAKGNIFLHTPDGNIIDHAAEKPGDFLDRFPSRWRQVRQLIFTAELPTFAYAKPVVRKDIHSQNIFAGGDQISRLLQTLQAIVKATDQGNAYPNRDIQL
jgi:hypothetical protein